MPKQVLQLSRSGTSHLLALPLLNPEVDCRRLHSMLSRSNSVTSIQFPFWNLATNSAGTGDKPSLRTNGETEVDGRSDMEPAGVWDPAAESLGLVDGVGTLSSLSLGNSGNPKHATVLSSEPAAGSTPARMCL